MLTLMGLNFADKFVHSEFILNGVSIELLYLQLYLYTNTHVTEYKWGRPVC